MTEQCGCGSEHNDDGSCKCGCGCSCGKHYHHHHEEGCNCGEKLLMIADEAWKELLKDKIKAKILAKKGDHLEKLAEIVAVANGEKWKHMISAKTKCNKYKDTLKEYFSSSD